MNGIRSYAVKKGIDQFTLWKDERPLLGHLDMELTERCNNNCIHCCINLPPGDMTAKKKELSTEEVKAILADAAALGALSVRLTGGEPLLREDFEEIYVFARRLGLKVLLFTNATLLTPNLVDLFCRIPPLVEIEISLYGMKRESYVAVTRTPGSFEAAMRGINLLLKKKVPFVVKGALLPSNKEEIDEFETWASTIPWMNGPPPLAIFYDLRNRRDSEEKNRIIKKLRPSPGGALDILARRREAYVAEMKEFCSKFTSPPGKRLFTCGAGAGEGHVDAYGNFQPCLLLKHPDTAFELKNETLKDAITRFVPELREMRAENPSYLSRCACCFLNGLCEQCPAKSWMEHGTLDTPVEYYCEITHAIARYLGILDKAERTWEVKDWMERLEVFTGKDLKQE